jgi:tetratricopeptide (TPR) repeat protein
MIAGILNPPSRFHVLAVLLLTAVVILVYGNSLRSEFVGDDYEVILENNFIKTWKNIPLIFSRKYLTPVNYRQAIESSVGSGEISYRPVVTLSYFLDYALWGFKPLGYHLTNLLLHLLTVLAVYLFFFVISNSNFSSLFGALLFAVHPAICEAVLFVGYREDLLCALLCILSLFFYTKSSNPDNSKPRAILWNSVSLGAFFLALLAKEMAVTFLFVIAAYEFLIFSRSRTSYSWRPAFKRLSGYAVVLLSYCLIRFVLFDNPNALLTHYVGGSFWTNALFMAEVFLKYLKWMLWPLNIPVTLNTYYPSISFSLIDPFIWAGICVFILIVFIAIAMRKILPLCSFAFFWVIITLMPVSNLTGYLANVIASRYLYLPIIGYCLALSIGISFLYRRSINYLYPHLWRKIFRDGAVLLILFYSTFTFIRTIALSTEIGVWQEIVEGNPAHPKAYIGLAYALLSNKGEADKAVETINKAITIAPKDPRVYYDTAILIERIGQTKEAIKYLQSAIALAPTEPKYYNSLGILYARLREWQEARKAWEDALRVKPNFAPAKDNLKKLTEGELLNRERKD